MNTVNQAQLETTSLNALAGRQKTRGICIYCGARPGTDPAYEETARALGTALAQSGHALIYGGGEVGMMGALANAALAAGGHVVGVIPQTMVEREWAHSGLSELIVVDTMHERKAAMAKRAQCYVALPGGLGTLEELSESLSWAQLGFHAQPLFLLNVHDYFNPLLSFINHSINQGFVAAADRALLHTVADVNALWTHPLFPSPTQT